MFHSIKDHPFAVEAFFKVSLVLTFAFPKEKLQDLLPECLELDTFNQWAFLAVAVVDTKGLRPKGFPAFLGNDFILAGYRLFVKYHTNNGKRLRGLYILKSETDKRLMELLGNIFTHYKYDRTDIHLSQTKDSIVAAANTSGFFIEVKNSGADVALPATSPFANWKEARRFAGPLPFTFSYKPETREVLIVEGVRGDWIPKPVEVVSCNIPFLETTGPVKGALANAFVINNISYYWKKGKIEVWNR
jgi:hypothetical protein